jgi:MEDS: MEthanogen/methylotroph, DcmR Sensory domain
MRCKTAIQVFGASGDMTLEFGPEKDFSKLVEYEYRLEEFMRRRPEFSGICQYHVETLPTEVVRNGLRIHQSVFVNETLSLMNPHYVGTAQPGNQAIPSPVLDTFIGRLLELQKSA